MKKIIFAIIIGVAGLSFSFSGRSESTALMLLPQIFSTAAKPVAEEPKLSMPPPAAALGADVSSSKNEVVGLEKTFQQVFDLHYKVIRSPQEKELMEHALSSIDNINGAADLIRTYDSSNLKENQKSRMDATLFLVRALELKNNPSAKHITTTLQQLVLDPSVEALRDPNLKRSVLGDRIELYLTLKEQNSKAAAALDALATTQLQKQVIEFAKSFHNLASKGR